MAYVSVIIPMYNSEKTIVGAIESVLQQTYKELLEIIIVNDGSTDKSEAVVTDFIQNHRLEKKIKLINKKNGGVSTARNLGIKTSTQEYIAFLDADDIWKPTKLEIQMKAFELYPEVVLVGANINQNKFEYFFWKKFDYYTNITLMNLIFKNFFPTPTVVLKKRTIDEIGCFNSTQRYAEEGDFFIRIAAKYKCLLVNESLVDCGDGKPVYGHSGLSGNLYEMEKGELRNLKMAYDSKFISFPIYCIAKTYSILKFFRRIIFSKMREA